MSTGPAGGSNPYGEQVARGTVRVDFDGQIGVAELRLPGQGTIDARIQVPKPCSTPPCTGGYDPARGKVSASYRVWSDSEQDLVPSGHPFQVDPATFLGVLPNVPAGQAVSIETVSHPAGYDSASRTLTYDGDIQSVMLTLSALGNVSGRVYSWHAHTPVAGATVRLTGGIADLGTVTTRAPTAASPSPPWPQTNRCASSPRLCRTASTAPDSSTPTPRPAAARWRTLRSSWQLHRRQSVRRSDPNLRVVADPTGIARRMAGRDPPRRRRSHRPGPDRSGGKRKRQRAGRQLERQLRPGPECRGVLARGGQRL